MRRKETGWDSSVCTYSREALPWFTNSWIQWVSWMHDCYSSHLNKPKGGGSWQTGQRWLWTKGRMYHSAQLTQNGWNLKPWEALVATLTSKLKREPVQQNWQVKPISVDGRRGLPFRKWLLVFSSYLIKTFPYCLWESSGTGECFGTSGWSQTHPQQAKHLGQGSTVLIQHSTSCFLILPCSTCHSLVVNFVNFAIMLEC